MSLRAHNNSLLPFPTPDRNRNIYYPNIYRDDLYDQCSRRSSRREDRENSPVHKDLSVLLDKSVSHHGDLGWNVEYATAWCYKHLIGNRLDIADAIDWVRELPEVVEETPFMIFDHLDRALFAGKLMHMVYLRWKSHASSSPGITSAPGVVKGVSRICIELNRTLFEEQDADIDDLLDALIHQMIHAWFLVACGAQPKGAKQDGRLMDGLHFGVIMLTICDICRDCRDGPLQLTFYAAKRREQYNGSVHCYPGYSSQIYVSLDPRGGAVESAAADGQSHCNHDNRKIRVADIRNWQVQHYSIALDLDLENKGDIIYDLGADQKLVPTDRLKGPPSATYVELIWNKKRIMIAREKALAFSSLKKPLEKDDKMELKMPDCDLEVFSCVYDFITKGVFAPSPAEVTPGAVSDDGATGPPILARITNGQQTPKLNGIISFIKVFQGAESIKFEELLKYALKKLYDLPVTYDDPIAALKELYEGKIPIHAELHKWARKFLLRRENGHLNDPFGGGGGHRHRGAAYGSSNYEKLQCWYDERFKDLYHRCPAFKDDCKIVVAELMVSEGGEENPDGALWRRPGLFALPAMHPHTLLQAPFGAAGMDPLDFVGRPAASPFPAAWSSYPGHHLGHAGDARDALGQQAAGLGRALLPSPRGRDAAYKWIGGNGKLKVMDRLNGQVWTMEG